MIDQTTNKTSPFSSPSVITSGGIGQDSPVASAVPTDWVALLWRRKLIVCLAFVATCGLGLVYYQRATPIYQSKAQLLLIKNEANLGISGAVEGVNYEETISTHMILLRSPMIVARALTKHVGDGADKRPLASLASLRDVADPIAAITYNLDAIRGGTRDAPDPYVIDLQYRGENPGDCGEILEAVIASYQEFLGETYQDYSQSTVSLIRQAKDELNRQLTEKEENYRVFRQSSPQLLTGPSGDKTNIPEMRMAEIEKARGEQLLRNTELEARIDAIESALEQGGRMEALALMASNADANQDNRTPRAALEQQLFNSLLEEQLLLENYGVDHPDVIAIRKKAKMLREYVGRYPSEQDGEPVDFVKVYLESLKQELRVGRQQSTRLNNLFDEQEKKAKSLARFQLADETYRNEIERTQQLFDDVLKRLKEVSLVHDPGGVKAKVISPPGVGLQVEPSLPVVLAISIGLGAVFGTLLAFGVDVADKRFRSPEDLRAQLQLPIIGHIPEIRGSVLNRARRNGDAALDPSLCTYHDPENIASESYRAVRTSLYFSTRGGDANRVIQVTSPTPGDGKTTLSANVAVAVANSGKKVLLLEADFRRPRFGSMFNLETRRGVSSVISGECELSEAIQRSMIKNLSVIPCGPRPHNPSELLTSPHFQNMLEVLREEYDLIVVDTPPLLAVTDPAVVAPRVDTVLLVVSLGKNVRSVAVRATEILENIGANVLGVVVNRFDRTSSYVSNGYRYGYGYDYKYGYGKGYIGKTAGR